jgi:biopolymer transport protein ExbD
VQIQKDEKDIQLNNIRISDRMLARALGDAKAQVKDEEQATVTIVAEVGVPFSRVQNVMEAANNLKMRAIIATQPNN